MEVYQDGKIHRLLCRKGRTISFEMVGITDKRGTKVTLLPDDEIFHAPTEDNVKGKVVADWNVVTTQLRETAFLTRGLKILVKDKRVDGRAEIFNFNHGVADYVEYLNDSRKPLHKPPIYFLVDREHILIECALQWSDNQEPIFHSFVNNRNTDDGGTHLTGIFNGLRDAVNRYARSGSRQHDFSDAEIHTGLTAVLSVRVLEPYFTGPGRGSLGNPEVLPVTESIAHEEITKWLDNNPQTAQIILNKICY